MQSIIETWGEQNNVSPVSGGASQDAHSLHTETLDHQGRLKTFDLVQHLLTTQSWCPYPNRRVEDTQSQGGMVKS
jgi:hypothetical protein